jgi:ABC-type antimicrobial peptide transport system permease subunit
MRHLIALQLVLRALTDTTRTTGGKALRRARKGRDSEAGLSTLEITIIALGLFLIAGIAVAVLTGATNSRLDQIE